MESIDFSKMLEKSKKRVALESKQIKKMSLYNYLNDNIPNLIIDCRDEIEDKINQEGGLIRDAFILKNFPINNFDLKTESRLILILEDIQDLKTSTDLEKLRTFIQNENKLDKGIFTIKQSDYSEFLKIYNAFIINENSDNLSKNLAKTNFPLLVHDNLLYVGNFFNSKNLHQLKALGIKSIIELLKEEDLELKKMFKNSHHIPIDEENHSEIDFLDIIDLIDSEKENDNTPILIYCFSGQTVSLAVCIAYLMKSKKWSLEFSTAYMMKICPNFKIPAWLYSQLQRLDLKNLNKNKIQKEHTLVNVVKDEIKIN